MVGLPQKHKRALKKKKCNVLKTAWLNIHLVGAELDVGTSAKEQNICGTKGGIYEPVGAYAEGKKQLSVVSFSPRQLKGARDFNNHCLIKSGNCSSKHTWLWSGGQIYERMGAYSNSRGKYKVVQWNPITDEEKAKGEEMEKDKDFSNGNFFDPTTMPKNEDQSWLFN